MAVSVERPRRPRTAPHNKGLSSLSVSSAKVRKLWFKAILKKELV